MTMKKRFLGLALAAAVALPATSAYADTTSITMDETETKTHNVTVTGSVKNKQGQAPAGKIEVELPTKMAFTVDENGNFKGATYNVTNKSTVGIDVSVANFSESKNGDGINLYPAGDMKNVQDKYRNDVSLVLTAGDRKLDLGDFANEDEIKRDLLTVAPQGVGSIVLGGTAGTKAYEESSANKSIDDNGTSEDFTLVFQIKKTK